MVLFFYYICERINLKYIVMEKVMIERAVFYEDLIKTVYRCERGHRHGADADIYRKMYFVEKRDKGYNLGVIVGIISAHLSHALGKAILINKENIDFVSKIEGCIRYLNEPTVEKLDKCVLEAWEAFNEIGFKIG